MSFSDKLTSCCEDYASFCYGNHYVALPYHIGGKKTPAQISEAISNWVGAAEKTNAEIQKYVTDNPALTGIDCSGLVYYVLNEASDGAVQAYFEDKLNKPGVLSYKYGITAANLTDAQYGTRITAANDIQPGCVIRFDKGGHVLVVDAVDRNSDDSVGEVWYTHSNPTYGPHYGRILIGDPTKDLNDAKQRWYDNAYTDSVAKGYYNYTLLLDPIAGLN